MKPFHYTNVQCPKIALIPSAQEGPAPSGPVNFSSLLHSLYVATSIGPITPTSTSRPCDVGGCGAAANTRGNNNTFNCSIEPSRYHSTDTYKG
ncbi:hypothetical protein BC938DRAFT_476995 [Jimgerdemannia flammicorona]|uniref:Uncharacterized protein n=1 Tax=Jimgerdemannia flammicorona TaxID=994334 RepID=A0A433QPY0_9FUNG|nr:hypothetical protein BC938DRAFT_476995 [Jimgerdemannia flammicorona]